MSLGNASPQRTAYPDAQEVLGLFVGGGAATNCTKDTTCGSKGIASVNYNAATGKYLITFTDVGVTPIEVRVNVYRAAGAKPIKANPVLGSFSSTAKTMQCEFWADNGTADALIDLLTTDKVSISARFIKNKVA